MAPLNRFVAAILFGSTLILLAGGCKTPDEPTSIPWNTPTEWERRGGIGLPLPEYD